MPTSRSNIEFLTIDFDPEPVILAAQFFELSHMIKSFKVPLERSVREVIAPSISRNFAEGGRPAWQPLANSTVSVKSFMGATNPSAPLIFSGKLKRVAGQYNLWNINGPEGEASISQEKLGEVWYGIVHQNGAETRFGPIPAREWAVFQEEDADKIEEIFWEWLGERMVASGVAVLGGGEE